MANKPLKPCRHPGCRTLTRSTWCAEHQPKPKQYLRGESAQWHGLYNLPAWRPLREDQLVRQPWCAECAKHGLRTRATVVDHIRPHRGDRRLFLDPDNLQSLCKPCHDRKTLQEQRERQKKR